MSKKNKERKEWQRTVAQARKITPGKLLRLFLKSIVFAFLVGVLFTLASLFNLPLIDNFWVQLVLIFGVYLLAYPFMMSEFRPKAAKRPKGK